MSSIAVVLLIWTSGLCLGTVRSEALKINCLEGESVQLQAPVSKNGLLKTDSGVQASVKNGRLDKVYNRKIHWSREDGFFYIMNVTITDTGNYNVENQDGQSKITHFSLAVYSPVSQPRVQASYSASQSNVSCSLLCSVENGRGVTLSWLTEGRSLISTKNSALSTNLTLQLEAAGLSEPLICSATNPFDSSTTSVRLEDYCPGKAFPSWMITLGVIVGLAVVLFILLIVYRCKNKQHSNNNAANNNNNNNKKKEKKNTKLMTAHTSVKSSVNVPECPSSIVHRPYLSRPCRTSVLQELLM